MTTHVDDHGGVFRCLLRIRENAGNDVMSDREFLRRYADVETLEADSSEWGLVPMKKAAVALSLNFDFQSSASYAELLSEHRAGHAVLVRIDGAQLGLHTYGDHDFRFTVLADMDELEMSLWCPLRNGQWDLLSSVSRDRWEQLQALGVTLLAPVPARR